METEFLDERKRADERAPFHDFGYRWKKRVPKGKIGDARISIMCTPEKEEKYQTNASLLEVEIGLFVPLEL